MGLNLNVVAQIYSLKHRDHQINRDCVDRLKQYIKRSLKDNKLSQDRLISTFLEGLRNNINMHILMLVSVLVSNKIVWMLRNMMISLAWVELSAKAMER